MKNKIRALLLRYVNSVTSAKTVFVTYVVPRDEQDKKRLRYLYVVKRPIVGRVKKYDVLFLWAILPSKMIHMDFMKRFGKRKDAIAHAKELARLK